MNTLERFRTQLIGIAGFALAAAVAVLAVVLIVGSGGDDGNATADPADSGFDPTTPTLAPELGVLDPQRPEVGEPAPDFALADVREPGVVRRLSDFEGTPVVLNWYASWCGPCKREIPLFQQAQDDLGDGLVIFGVNLLESQDKALGILQELEATYPAVRDTNGNVSDHYRVSSMPTTYFIDSEGIVRVQHLGAVEDEQFSDLLAEIGVDWEPEEEEDAASAVGE